MCLLRERATHPSARAVCRHKERERASNSHGAGDANGDANGERGRRTNHEWTRDAREDFVCRWDDDDDVFNVDISFISVGSGVDDENDGRWVWTPEDTETRGWGDDDDDDGGGGGGECGG